MNNLDISAEEIAFALRQAESGVAVGIIAASLSVDEETFYQWKMRYSQLFQSMVLGRQSSGVCILYREYDPMVETELRNCKIRHSEVRDMPAAVAELLRKSKKVGFYHGPLRFNVEAFGGPTLLVDEAEITIRKVVPPGSGDQGVDGHVEIKTIRQAASESQAAFLVLSAEIGRSGLEVAPNRSSEGSHRSYTLRKEVDNLYGFPCNDGALQNENDQVLLCEGPLRISLQAIARSPADAFRTFYTSDLDVMLLGNFLLEK